MKKKILTLCFMMLSVLGYGQQRIYVSTNGSDKGDGTMRHPYHTLTKALSENMSCSRVDTLFVEVGAGDYFLDRAVVLSGANTRPIVVRSSQGEKANFIGGVVVDGWEKCSDGKYRAYIPAVKQYGFSFEQFYVNGARATYARTPNEEWFFVKSSKESAFVASPNSRRAEYAVQRINLSASDMLSLKGMDDSEKQEVQFSFYHKWDVTQKRADYIEVDSSCVFIKGVGLKPWNSITKGTRYVMRGYKGALDAQGEWYLDRNEGYVYYLPYEGEDMAKAVCVAPTISQWLVIKGSKSAKIENISFENISFSYSSLPMPLAGNEPMQAAASIEASIELDHVNNIRFYSCSMQHTGGYAIWFKQECHNNTVDRCYIADLGAGGVKIGEPYMRLDSRAVTSHNTVNNCIITNAGNTLPCGVGVGVYHSASNKITHNDISYIRYSGVSVGWVWGYDSSEEKWVYVRADDGTLQFVQAVVSSVALDNLVAYNHVHHIGLGELCDMGAIYTLGEQKGTKITHNIVHDVVSYDYGAWGLYTDEGSSNIELTNNLVYRCKSGSYHLHYGKENIVENNIFALGDTFQAKFTRQDKHLSFAFNRNIILHEKGVTLEGGWLKGKVNVSSNLYWNTQGELKLGGVTIDEWRKQKEPDALVMDPCFKDAEAGDFTFTSRKAYKKIGFIPFDLSRVGVYGSEEWVDRAKRVNY